MLSVTVFSGLAIYGDTKGIAGSLLVLSPLYWLATLGLILVHVLVRLLRWNYYVRLLGVSADSRVRPWSF